MGQKYLINVANINKYSVTRGIAGCMGTQELYSYVVNPLAIANGRLRGILDSENSGIVAGRWTVDCGLGTCEGLGLVGKSGGEQLMPPSIALLSTPTSCRLLSVFPWVLL